MFGWTATQEVANTVAIHPQIRCAMGFGSPTRTLDGAGDAGMLEATSRAIGVEVVKED